MEPVQEGDTIVEKNTELVNKAQNYVEEMDDKTTPVPKIFRDVEKCRPDEVQKWTNIFYKWSKIEEMLARMFEPETKPRCSKSKQGKSIFTVPFG